jgi:hypothetical protein
VTEHVDDVLPCEDEPEYLNKTFIQLTVNRVVIYEYKGAKSYTIRTEPGKFHLTVEEQE